MTFLSVSACVLYVLVVTCNGAPDEIGPPTSTQLTSTTRAPALEQTLNGTFATKALLCSEKPCVRKCCNGRYVVVMESDAKNSGSCWTKKKLNLTQLSLPNPVIYDRNLLPTNKNLSGSFQLISGYELIVQYSKGFRCDDNFYIVEDGTLLMEFPNMYPHWRKYDNDNFCIDYLHVGGGEVILRPFVLFEESPKERDYTVSLIAMLISSFFLAATLTVYSYVPRLRCKLHGKVLMAYAAALLGFFLTQSILGLAHHIGNNIETVCHAMGLPSYYMILASFFWMNVMSFDIWSKYRRTLHHSTSKMDNIEKFKWYCMYAFGAPLAMTIMFAFLNYLPMDKINSAVVTPGISYKSCFLGGMERLFYLYIPMSILIAANFVLFLATAFTIYNLNRISRECPGKSHKTQFLVYLRVFLVMGVSWVLEIVSSVQPGLLVWQFTDALNCLMGLFIFLIFVCNKRVNKMFVARYRGNHGNPKSLTTKVEGDDLEDSEDEIPRGNLLSIYEPVNDPPNMS